METWWPQSVGVCVQYSNVVEQEMSASGLRSQCHKWSELACMKVLWVWWLRSSWAVGCMISPESYLGWTIGKTGPTRVKQLQGMQFKTNITISIAKRIWLLKWFFFPKNTYYFPTTVSQGRTNYNGILSSHLMHLIYEMYDGVAVSVCYWIGATSWYLRWQTQIMASIQTECERGVKDRMVLINYTCAAEHTGASSNLT